MANIQVKHQNILMVNIQVKHENILSEYFDGEYSGENILPPEGRSPFPQRR